MSTLDAEKHGNDTHTNRSFRYHFWGKTFRLEGHLQEASEGVLFFYRQRLFWFWCGQVAGIPFWCLFLDGLFRGGPAVRYHPGHNEWIYLNTQVHIGQQLFTLQLPYNKLITTYTSIQLPYITADLGYLFFTRKHNPRSSHISWCHILQFTVQARFVWRLRGVRV